MTKKRIKILTTGAIRVKGFINGPVLTPYFEDISTIFSMVSSGVHIVEVCDDGVEIELNTSNFTDDNSKAARDARDSRLHEHNTSKDESNEEVVNDVESEVKEVTSGHDDKESEVTEEEATSDEKSEIPEVDIKVDDPIYNKYNNRNNRHQHNNYKNNKNYNKNDRVRAESNETIKITE